MYIEKIVLNNFRVYKGKNVLDLAVTETQNVSIITGNNGFGKTSLLTSLVWCLYGKLMVDVDERYSKEIRDSGGYKAYCNKLMNRLALDEITQQAALLEAELIDAAEVDKAELVKKIATLYTFEVSLTFKKIFVPALPCDSLEVKRIYNTKQQTESLEIYIDGQINELTKNGPEIFINDFIIRKEIAKFFFFDAEKIVELAEISSIDDRRNLSKAYGEVLGIKKYLDLKTDLENLRLRLKKKGSSVADKEKLEKLQKSFDQNAKLIEHHSTMIEEKQEELSTKKFATDKLQEQLIREGSSISLEELKDFKQMREHLHEESLKLKSQMKEMLELAPLAIASSKLEMVRKQIETEQEQKDKKNNDSLLKRKATALKKGVAGLALSTQKREQLLLLIENVLLPTGSFVKKALFDYSTEQENIFFEVYDTLQNSFSRNFKSLTSELKKNYTSFTIVNRKLLDAESKENDPVIKTIRNNKNQLLAEIKSIEAECIELKASILSLQGEQNSISSQVSELTKRVNVENIDKEKDELAEKLIVELDAFIYKLKNKKKSSLAERINNELHILMHKKNFVKRVDVVIEGELIDIDLYDTKERKIDKTTLSKGEQQLYATALLKALIDESNIRFPVFIDSPLQKFDKEHAKNIIEDFYPHVSSQVILFPLLEKELNEDEFKLLYPKISDCYLITNLQQYHSYFQKVEPENLFTKYQKTEDHVYRN